MVEHPLLCNDRTARNLLRGTQTQVRRPVRDCKAFRDWGVSPEQAYDVDQTTDGRWGFLVAGDQGWTAPIRSPFGVAGDRLWGREAWRYASYPGTDVIYRSDSAAGFGGAMEDIGATLLADEAAGRDPFRWRPSIHMPRWACRLTLRVGHGWVERAQDVGESDIRAQGVTLTSEGDCWEDAWRRFWSSLYAGSWERNDWVWACEVEREGTRDE